MTRDEIKLYATVIVDHGEYRHYGEVLSRVTPTDTVMVRMVPTHPGTLREMPIAQLHPVAVRNLRWLHYAAVSGRGVFPIDMLRYDFCAPLNFDPETKVIDPSFGLDTMMVAKVTPNRFDNFTPARWSSFGYNLINFSTEALASARESEHGTPNPS